MDDSSRHGSAGPRSNTERSKDTRRGKRQLDDGNFGLDIINDFNQDDDDEPEMVSTVLAKKSGYTAEIR
jgi:hypothetical protein